MKLRTIGLALVAGGFLASSALAQGTMQPIPNPPEKAKPMKHKGKHKGHHAEHHKMKGDEAKKDEATPATPAPKT